MFAQISSMWKSTSVTTLIFSSLVLYLVSSLSIAAYNVYLHPLANYPGPAIRAAFYLPDLLTQLRGTAYLHTKRLHDRYGSVVRVSPNALSYNTSQAWKDIYALKPDRTEFAKDQSFYDGGTHILTATQADHSRQRRLLAPAFSENALHEQEPMLNVYFDLLIAKLKQQIDGPSGGIVDMMAYYNYLTFDIIGDLVVGQPFGCLEGGQYHSWIRNVFESIKMLGVLRFVNAYRLLELAFGIVMLIPSIADKQKSYFAFVEQKVDARLGRKTDRKDIVTHLLGSSSQTEETFSRKELLGNARILMTAGSETTATHLSGATWLLLNHPDVLNRLQTEIRTCFQNAEDIDLKSVVNEQRLPYLTAVIKETFRIYPSVPATLPRMTGSTGGMIDGKYVPANTSIGVHQWSTYRSESNFAAPDDFRPERWLPDEAPAMFHNDNAASLQPFLLGPRVCIGKSLGYFEIRSALVRVLWHFDMTLAKEDQDWMNQQEFVLWDKSPLLVKLQHRSP